MSKILQKAISTQRRSDGKIPVKRMIQRGGKSFQQTYWVSPAQAKKMRERAQKDVKGVVKAGKEVFTDLDTDARLKKLYSMSLQLPRGFAINAEKDAKKKWNNYEFDRDAHAKEFGEQLSQQVAIKAGSDSKWMEFYKTVRDDDWQKIGEKEADAFISRAKTRNAYGRGGTPADKPPSSEMATVPLTPEDKAAAEDLQLTLDNDGDFHRKVLSGVRARHKRQWVHGDYDQKKALDLYRQAIKDGRDKFYGKNDPESREKMTPWVVEQVARDMEQMARENLEFVHGPLEEKIATSKREAAGRKKKKKKDMGEMVVEDENLREEMESGADFIDLSFDDLADTYAAPEGYEFAIEHAEATESSWGVPSLEMNGTIYDDNMNQVGTMKRALHRDEDGELHATHHLLKLNEYSQDEGVGTRMVLNQFEQYEALGVRSVTLDTAWVGKYLWLKLGFKPTEEDEPKLRRDISAFIEDADLEDEQKSAVYQMLDGDLINFARIRGLPEVGYSDPETGNLEYAPINKAALLNKGTNSWSGRIEVEGEDWDTTMEILNGYLED